jgi:hypothetical protein
LIDDRDPSHEKSLLSSSRPDYRRTVPRLNSASARKGKGQ